MEREFATAAERIRRNCFVDLCVGCYGWRVQACEEGFGIRPAFDHAAVVVPDGTPGSAVGMEGRTWDEREHQLFSVRIGASGGVPAVDPSRIAAKRLGVHRHTFAIRFRRAEMLCVRRLDDPRGVLLLRLAILGYQLPANRTGSVAEERVEEGLATS